MTKDSLNFQNILCWDTVNRPKVMDTVALRVHDSIFHATHFPCPISKLNPNTRARARYSEEELYKDFLDERKDHTFCAAVGDSGTGKSHLIRWLSNRMLLDETFKNENHCVLVPRHCANLAAVIECVLEGFDSPEVQRIKNEVKWTHSITHQGACTRVISELAFVLDPRNLSSSQLTFPDDEEHQLVLDLIPAFLNDQAIREHLISKKGGIISRLAEHLSGERKKRPDDEESLSWCENDLDFNAVIIDKAGNDAAELASALLQDDELKKLATKILNKALGKALPNLAGLKQGNLKSALAEIRSELKTYGKQLILLIEDLSVAQGVDAELVESLLIAPSDGGSELCCLRSIVGLTNEDFDRLQENLKGRIDIAVHFDIEISLEGESGDQKIGISELNDFASRYLNAARYNLKELQNFINLNPKTPEFPSFCIEKECPYIEDCHNIFGAVNGKGLYPLSLIAIERLYRQQIKETAAKISFNPRLLVSQVLNYFLNEAERMLPAGTFPTPNYIQWFKLAEVSAPIQADLENSLGPDQGKRLRTALEIYSKNPFTGKLDPRIAGSFGLPTKIVGEKAGPGIEQPKPKPPTQNGHSEPQLDEFDIWVNKKTISDQAVTRWRKVIYAAIRSSNDWDADSLGADFNEYFTQKNIHIESQATKTRGDVVLTIKRTAEAATAIKGLVNNFSLSNAGEARKSLVFASEQIRMWIIEIKNQINKIIHAPGKPSPNKLAIQALALGTYLHPNAPKTESPQEFLRSVLSPWYEKNQIFDLPQGSRAWNHLYSAYIALGENVRNWLFKKIVCRKGNSMSVSFIDTSRILDDFLAVQKQNKAQDIADQSKKWQKNVYKDILELTDRTNRHFENAIENETKIVKGWLNEFDNYFGKQQPSTTFEALKNAFDSGIELDLFYSKESEDVPEKLNSLNGNYINEQLRLMRAVAGKVSLREKIEALAMLDRELVQNCLTTTAEAESTLKNAYKNLQKKIEYEGLEEPDKLHKEIADLLKNNLNNLEILKDNQQNE